MHFCTRAFPIPIPYLLFQKFNLPNINGAVRPYQIAIDLYHISGSAYEMKFKLTGGANSIPERNIHSNVWSLPFEDITDMYIKTVEGNKTKKYFLFNGTKRFIDPNMRVVFHNFYKQIFDMGTTPFTGSFFIILPCLFFFKQTV